MCIRDSFCCRRVKVSSLPGCVKLDNVHLGRHTKSTNPQENQYALRTNRLPGFWQRYAGNRSRAQSRRDGHRQARSDAIAQRCNRWIARSPTNQRWSTGRHGRSGRRRGNQKVHPGPALPCRRGKKPPTIRSPYGGGEISRPSPYPPQTAPRHTPASASPRNTRRPPCLV